MIRRLFSGRPAARPSGSARLRVEFLEARETPTVNVLSIGAQEMASDRSYFLPLTVTNTPNGDVTYQVNTGSAALTGQVLTGRTVQFDVTNGAGVNGTITVQLFDDIAPKASQRIVDLINSNFYDGKLLFRVDDLGVGSETNIIVQGGGANNTDNSSLGSIEEEFNPNYTFASNGLFALAKTSFPDTSNSQFFFTDIDRGLAERPEDSLNYRYTILGTITAGFDVYTAIKNAPRTGTTPSPNITITDARVLSSSPNRVIQFTPASGGFTGTTSVTVTTTDSDGPTTTTFNLTGIADPNGNSPPFLQAVPDTMTATAGEAMSFTVTPFDREGNAVTYVVRNADFTGAPANLSFNIDQATGKITITPAASFTGTAQFKVGVRQSGAADTPGSYAAQLVTLTVDAPPSPPPPTTDVISATGSAAGTEPRVTVRNADGSERYSVLVFEPGFTGGVRVAVADVTGDGKDDVVAVPGFGGSPVVKVLDGTTGAVLLSRLVFEDTFRGGLFVDTGDGRNLGYAQILVGAGDSGGPRVTLFDARTNTVLLNYFAADFSTRGGVTVAIDELVTGEGRMIVTGSGPGTGPVVNVYSPQTGSLVGSFLAGNANERDGIRVRIADTVQPSSNVRLLYVAPFYSSGTDGEEAFDVTDYIDFE